MDPNATWKTIIDTEEALEDRCAAAICLLDWINNGGFWPEWFTATDLRRLKTWLNVTQELLDMKAVRA